jgi:hypothetical protein
MIVEAHKRSEGLDLPIEFYVGSIYHLDFTDNTLAGLCPFSGTENTGS